ncbi:hypothetical protein CBR_g41031 [Chara braunii]|uniref:Reverse transcriptase domain-containing protein n=1 Tax=Chara braunii TaxID=69332 RepID=A0A388LUY7_CHABU|nr:hypothetical protein CBR_g41031 [Chara braunii]|eukprot:GBG86128.1 hypothetical protein CBR_g41031 [Chara braunii]
MTDGMYETRGVRSGEGETALPHPDDTMGLQCLGKWTRCGSSGTPSRTRDMGYDFANEGWDVVSSRAVIGGWEELSLPYQLVQTWVPHFVAGWFGGYEHIRAVAESLDEVDLAFTWLADAYYKISLEMGPFHGDRAREIVDILKIFKEDQLEVDDRSMDAILRREVAATPSYAGDVFLLFEIAEPIRAMIHEEGSLDWTEEREVAVQTLKDILTSEEVTLAAPCFNDEVGRPFVLETDGGPLAVGGVLIQRVEDGKERPVRFESRTLNSAERRYSQFKKEVLAVLHCLKTFQTYLFGRRFILRINPTNVAGALKNYKPIDPTVGRWVGFIWQFDYKIERIAGLRNRADGLSGVCITRAGVEDMEPIDAFLDYEGGTLVVDNEKIGPACTSKELLIKALEKGSLTVVVELGEGALTSSARPYKMPTFRIEKFDDYTHQDPVVWWQGFTTELGIHEVPDHLFISALFINTKGGCQIWLSHMATIHGVQVSDLYKKVSWEDMTKEWKKRFIVDDAPTLAINRIFTMAQGSTPTRDWLTDWQKIVATPDLDLSFPHLRREFYNRSCAALSLALGDREQYNTFAEIINKARELIKTNRFGRLASGLLHIWGERECRKSWIHLRGYAVHLVPPLDQPLHVQQSIACTVSSPSATDSAPSPQSIAGDSTSWSRLEELDPLTFTDFQWMPVPSTRRLPKPHCNALMAQLRDYLHTAVPAPLMDAGAEVVDLHAYIAKIDREFMTQRYDDIDAPLLYIRIQIGEAICSVLIDCGATRNYISQDLMVRVGLGPHVRRKSQPTQVTLADSHTHKSIDRCIDAVPVYIAPYASEVVSFDILDTKFDMILESEVYHGSRGLGEIFKCLDRQQEGVFGSLEQSQVSGSNRGLEGGLGQVDDRSKANCKGLGQVDDGSKANCKGLGQVDDGSKANCKGLGQVDDGSKANCKGLGGGWVELRWDQEIRGQAGVIAKVKVKGGHVGGRANDIVVGNLGGDEQLIPIMLVGMIILPQDSLERIVHLLGLSVGLWVECSVVPERGSVGMEELFPELGEEAGVAITDDILGEAVVSGDMVEEENGNVFGIVRGGTRNEMSAFGQTTNNDVDAIMPAIGLGKTAHEVHGNGLSSVRGDGQLLELTGFGPVRGVDSLTCGARADVGFDVGKDRRPMEISGDSVKGFLETKVASVARPRAGCGGHGYGGEVGAREVSLGVAMAERWQELDVGHGGIDFLGGFVIGAAGEGIGNAVALARGVTNGKDNVTKVFYARGSKCAFAELGVKFLVAEDGENLAEMIKVGLEGGAKNKDVVEVHHDTDFEEVAEDVVHGGLECGGGVGETERHYEKLVVPEAGAKGGLVGVLLADADLVEATAEVDLGEVFGSTEAIKKFGYPGKRILVLDRDPVQGAVVCAHAEFRGIVLLDEETAGSEWGGARLNESFFKEFIELALHFFGLEDGELVWGAARGGVAGLGIDGVGNTSVGRKARGDLFETRGLGGGGRLGGQALSFHPHEMDSLEVFLGELGWVKGLGRGVKAVVGGEWRVVGGHVVEEPGAVGGGWSLRAEVRKAIMVEKVGKEIGERELGLMGEGCGEVGEAYPLDAGDEDLVGNESRRDVEAEGANVLDESLGGAGLAEVAKLIDVVIDGLLRMEGGDEKVGPLKEGILNLREEKEDVLVGEAGERRDIDGAEGAGNVLVAGDNASEGVEVAVVGRGVVVGVILIAVTKEVARGRLGYGGVNARKDLGEGELRLCIDYRELNSVTVKNVEPLPRIDDLLDQLQGYRYFSKIDLQSGYHQIEVAPEDQHKTTFRTRALALYLAQEHEEQQWQRAEQQQRRLSKIGGDHSRLRYREPEAHLLAERQQRQKHQQEVAALTAAVRDATTQQQQQQQQQLLNSTLARINDIEAKTSAAPGCTTDATKRLNERIDHVVTIIDELGDFTSPATISSTVAAIKTSITNLQTRLDAATKNYKMPHFHISKFDDDNKSDALTWWQRFLTEASCRTVPADDMMKALYLQLIGGAHAWMNHLAATKKCTIAELHTHVPWKEFEKLWFTRFMVRNVVKAAMNEVYTCSQGNMPTRDWTTKIRDAIARNDVEEMGLVFLHALPSPDGPAASPPDPRITHLLDEYGDVFEAPTGTVPDRPLRHGITLEAGAVPPRGCIYRMSEEELEVLRAQLDDLLDKCWIRPSCSSYGAPVLFVRKKNKDLRLCIDYRKLNAQTVKNASPLPRIDDLLERLGGATYFSKLDLKLGYHQIDIQPQDRYKTAFKTRYGHFEWVVMPFGLTNAPATFQAAMTTEFRDVLDRSVLIYLDDILVYSRTLNEHIVHLRAVLNRLRLAKYKANRDKCELAKQELEYLGHYVMPKGIRPLVDKIQAIVDWPEPRCTTDVRSFMGLAGYYQRFVDSYSKVAALLSILQSPKVPFEFDDAARGAFTTLKAAMQAAPALRIYDPTLPTQVTTDASGYGIGAMLEQCHEDGWHPVEYFSQKVPLVNTLDDARKKELLSFVTVLKRWGHFLLGRRRFKWNTNNNPLTFYKMQDTVTSTIGRWMYYIDKFDFDPCHIPGPANRAVDALSRRSDFCVIVTTTFNLEDDLQPHFVKGYKSDPTYSTLYAELSSDHPPASHYRISEGFLLLHTRGKYLTGFSTTPYSKEQEERVAAHLLERKEKMEKRELIKQAKMLALLEEQEAKKRQMEELKEQEEKMTAIQEEVEKEEEEEEEVEEEEPLERRRGEARTSKEMEIARIAEEWAAHLELGEDREAEMAIPQKEREAARRQIETETDPVFSKIDLKLGYHQIEVYPDDQYKTAFRTRYGHYEFIVMPFGLTKAPATFQRCMNDLFRPWLDRFVVVYLDDILMFSKTLEEHEGHLRQILSKFRESNFKINPKKCEWAKTQVLYLGYVLDGDGIRPEDSKIASFRDWPTPKTLTELRSFLGLANYYRKFVRNFSTIVAPLRRLLKKETIWKWDQDCTSAFKKLKKALIEYPVLEVVDPSLLFVVTTNASQYGIGVILQQDDGNSYRPVEFMSARLPSEKVAASTYERELYALRQALKHWKHYLLGRHFKVYSVHETLRWLKTQAKMTPKLTRWAAEIDQYNFELKPVKGKYNVVADARSRRSDYFGAIVHYLDIGADMQQKIRDAYAQDPIYSELLKRVKEAPNSPHASLPVSSMKQRGCRRLEAGGESGDEQEGGEVVQVSLVSLCYDDDEGAGSSHLLEQKIIKFPVPYKIPPEMYTPEG